MSNARPHIFVPHGAKIPDTWRRVGENLPWNSTLDMRLFYAPGNSSERKPNVAAFDNVPSISGQYQPILILGDGELDKDEMGEIAERAREKRQRNKLTESDIAERREKWRMKLYDHLQQVIARGKREWRTNPLPVNVNKPRGGIFTVA